MSNTNRAVLFFTFYGFRDYIQHIKEEFENQGYSVEDIPYLALRNDHKLTDGQVADSVIDTVTKSYETDHPIDSIFMFLLPPHDEFMSLITDRIDRTRTKIVFYNFDDPISTTTDIVKFSRGIDLFFTPNILTLNRLRSIVDVGKIIHHPLFLTLDSEFKNNTYKDPAKLKYDICILYDEDFAKAYETKALIKAIKFMALDKDLSIKLLGPSNMESVYSDIYEGEFSIDNVHRVCEDSKVILYLKSNMYTLEKLDLILAELMLQGNIIMMPYCKKIDHLVKSEFNCVYLADQKTNLETLYSLVIKYKKFRSMEKNSHRYIKGNFNIAKWVGTIIHHIQN